MITQRPYFERDGTAIYLGDCNSLLPELQPETIDLILTDPPYGVAYQSAHRTERSDLMKSRATIGIKNSIANGSKSPHVCSSGMAHWSSSRATTTWATFETCWRYLD